MIIVNAVFNIFVVLITIFCFITGVYLIITQRKLDQIHERNIHSFIELMTKEPSKPFVVSEYLSRIEREHIKTLEERNKEPTYIITLWIGLDGLRMNEDETLEWVSRAKKESEYPQDKVVTRRQMVYRASFGDTSANFQWNEASTVQTVPIRGQTYCSVPTPTYPSYIYQQPVFPIPWMNQPMQATTQWKGPIETAIQQQILQSIQMQTAQIDNNIRIMEMLNSQQNCNQIHQIWLDKQQRM